MRRIHICICILVFIVSLTLVNGVYLRFLTDAMTEQLQQAETAASGGDWALAEDLTAQSKAEWERHQLYFCITLRRADTDAVEVSFHEIEPLLHWQEKAEYASANAALIANIRLLNGTESLDLKNLL